MCGFIGWAGREASAESIRCGVDAIEHRGPDAAGVRALEGPDGAGGTKCVLGSVRLRIIDLSPEGDQPMSNEDGSAWVSFNGELYNHPELRAWLDGRGHTFRSKTDTEDLIHAYEEHADDPAQMLERLRGMFAFAIWDASRGRLFMARDRLGIKPMYYASTSDGGVAFSSEIRALARAGVVTPTPDADAIRGYLLRGVIPGPASAFEGVRELPAGCLATWEGVGPPRVRRWWSPSIAVDPSVAAAPAEALAEVLDDAVARHLVADRPVGVFLSSGVDSGAIATVAAKRGTVRTFTVTFPDLGDDEGDAAAELAGRIGASHQRVPVTGGDIEAWVRRVLADMDQPTHDGVNSWLVCQAAHEAGLVVALSGLGGDELFGGYASFSIVPRVTRWRQGLAVMPRGVRHGMARTLAKRHPGARVSRVLSSPSGVAGAYGAVRGLFSPAEIPGVDPFPARVSVDGLDPHDAVTMLETTTYMADQLLRDTDQMSMAHSLEVRVPLLDDDFVEVAMSIPAVQRTEPGKALLVRASGLPIVHAKRPFALPFDRWIAGPLREMVREGLLSESLPFADLVPQDLRHRLWTAVEKDRVQWAKPWAVTVLRMWPGANGLDW